MQIRGNVHNGIASGFYWTNRAGDWLDGKPWDASRVMNLPDRLKAKSIDLHFASDTPNVLLQIINDSVSVRLYATHQFRKGEWLSGSFSYQLV